MYKIYINETPLILAKLNKQEDLPPSGPNKLVNRYPGLAKMILNYVDMLEKNRQFDYVYLYSEDYDQLVADFKSHFRLIEAAGGLVFNQDEEILAIFRRGSWDLPKGKIDPGETPPVAAVREVQEETGLQKVSLGEHLIDTYHTYRLKSGKRVLKRTYWYLMRSSKQDLIPQTEEDIEKALWIGPEAFLKEEHPMYNTIRHVVEAGLKDA
ncbi:MAG TPA: NUDIX hydrolase [Saprospiraceae bacterium]|nr:NUDIX hydrolase [Saprospiraceae bacterium]